MVLVKSFFLFQMYMYIEWNHYQLLRIYWNEENGSYNINKELCFACHPRFGWHTFEHWLVYHSLILLITSINFFHTWHDIIYVYAIISILWLLLYYYLFHVPFCGRWHCCRGHEKVFGQVWKEMGWQSSPKNSREDTFGGCNRYCGGLWAPLHNRRIYFWNYPIVLWSVNSLHFLFALSCSTYIWIFMDGPIKNLDPILEMVLI